MRPVRAPSRSIMVHAHLWPSSAFLWPSTAFDAPSHEGIKTIRKPKQQQLNSMETRNSVPKRRGCESRQRSWSDIWQFMKLWSDGRPAIEYKQTTTSFNLKLTTRRDSWSCPLDWENFQNIDKRIEGTDFVGLWKKGQEQTSCCIHYIIYYCLMLHTSGNLDSEDTSGKSDKSG